MGGIFQRAEKDGSNRFQMDVLCSCRALVGWECHFRKISLPIYQTGESRLGGGEVMGRGAVEMEMHLIGFT